MKALLAIDMQKGSFTALTPRHDTVFRANSLPVFFIQHDGTIAGDFVPHTPEWELLDNLEVEADDILVKPAIAGTPAIPPRLIANQKRHYVSVKASNTNLAVSVSTILCLSSCILAPLRRFFW